MQNGITRFIYLLAVLLALTVFMQVQTVQAEEGKTILGAQAGEVGLSQDVGATYGNALGLGAFLEYGASDFLEFQLSWLNSYHSSNGLSLNQNAYAMDAVWDIDQFDIFTPYLEGGAEFVTHTQTIANPASPTSIAPYNSTGFGLNVGAGAKLDLGSHLMAGLDFIYHNMFTATVTPPGSSTSVNAVESYFTVLLRLGISFDSGNSYLNRPDKPLAP